MRLFSNKVKPATYNSELNDMIAALKKLEETSYFQQQLHSEELLSAALAKKFKSIPFNKQDELTLTKSFIAHALLFNSMAALQQTLEETDFNSDKAPAVANKLKESCQFACSAASYFVAQTLRQPDFSSTNSNIIPILGTTFDSLNGLVQTPSDNSLAKIQGEMILLRARTNDSMQAASRKEDAASNSFLRKALVCTTYVALRALGYLCSAFDSKFGNEILETTEKFEDVAKYFQKPDKSMLRDIDKSFASIQSATLKLEEHRDSLPSLLTRKDSSRPPTPR